MPAKKFVCPSKLEYKQKKRLKNAPENWQIAENTHEAMIDKETFEAVQRLLANKKRPYADKARLPLFSGLLICADCGHKLHSHTYTQSKGTVEFYSCSNNRGRSTSGIFCTAHYIRRDVLVELVSEDLKYVMDFVQDKHDEFIRIAMEDTFQEKRLVATRVQREIAAAQTRLCELDKFFKRIYEDNITGKLSDERFDKLSIAYETEQNELQASIKRVKERLSEIEKQGANMSSFISAVRRHIGFTELSVSILNELIEKIVIHEADKSSSKWTQRVDIYYSFGIGKLKSSGDIAGDLLSSDEREKTA